MENNDNQNNQRANNQQGRRPAAQPARQPKGTNNTAPQQPGNAAPARQQPAAKSGNAQPVRAKAQGGNTQPARPAGQNVPVRAKQQAGDTKPARPAGQNAPARAKQQTGNAKPARPAGQNAPARAKQQKGDAMPAGQGAQTRTRVQQGGSTTGRTAQNAALLAEREESVQQEQQAKAPARRTPQRRGRTPSKSETSEKLRIIPLGGLDEIGKNITVLEYGDDMIVIDCGSIFPNDDMPGVDLVIPDVDYLLQNRGKLRGMLITHGHEDHIGSVPHVVKRLGGGAVPIYGTRLTLALIEHKLKEHRMVASADLRNIKAGDSVKLGVFEVEFINVNHSITDAVALSIKTPVGTVIFTGDFKIDYTPIDGDVTDLKKFAELGRQGVLALFMESTNVERPGYTMSERTVGETFGSLFPLAKGRIIIAMFSSNVHRVQQVVDSAVRFGRMVCLTGRSMLNYSSVAQELDLLKIPHGRLIDVDDLDSYADEEIVIVTTGSQGENMAGLSRMAFDEHRKLSIRSSDTVVISSHPIPGNEKSVSRVINQLFHKGANVIYEALADVHVSGHACQEELKLMHALIAPKYFVPVHGEYRHLKRHAQLAKSMGMADKDVIIAAVGDVIEFGKNSARISGQVQAGQVLLDGSSIGDVGNIVLRDRKLLSQDGLLVVVMPVDLSNGKLCGQVEIVSRGFVYMRESEELLEEVKRATQSAVAACQVNKAVDINAIKNAVRDAVRDLLYKRTKRTPMVLPVVVESKGDAAWA